MRTRLIATALLLTLPLSALAAIPGDANTDGTVNFADFHVWKDNVGKWLGKSHGDFDKDCTVDGDDYLIWQNEFLGLSPFKKADANHDHTVDTLDYAIWVENFGKSITFEMGDFNGDCRVDGIDFLIWLHNFGKSESSSSSTSSSSSSTTSSSSISSSSSSTGTGSTSSSSISSSSSSESSESSTSSSSESSESSSSSVSSSSSESSESSSSSDSSSSISSSSSSTGTGSTSSSSISSSSSSESTSSSSESSSSSSEDPCLEIAALTLDEEVQPLVDVGCSSSSSSESSSSSSEESSESSSSSEQSSSQGSTSSASSESSEPTPEPQVQESFTIPESGNGAHRGHQTNVLGGVTRFIAGFFNVSNNGVAPGAFGGTDNPPFTQEEQDYICSMKSAINENDEALLDWFAAYIAGIMGRDVSVIKEELLTADYCEPSRPQAAVERKALQINVAVDGEGYPVSTNPVWNACIRGGILTPDLIKSNEDRVEHRSDNRPLTCRDYHKGDVSIWSHPDHPNLQFYWDAETKTMELPAGYVSITQGVPVFARN